MNDLKKTIASMLGHMFRGLQIYLLLLKLKTIRVYSDWTRLRQFYGVKHDAMDLEHMFIKRSIHAGRAALEFLYNSDAVVSTLARPV